MKTKWNPSEDTLNKINSSDYYVSFKAFRVSSSGYINKKYVKEHVYSKCNNKCNNCNSTKELHIDHIVSVHESFKTNRIYYCNTLDNLQLLCSKCNLKKGGKYE